MRGQRDLDLVVDVEPFGMVVAFLGHQRDAGHEGEGFAEIRELETARDRLAVARQRPAMQRPEPALAFVIVQLSNRHEPSPSLVGSRAFAYRT